MAYVLRALIQPIAMAMRGTISHVTASLESVATVYFLQWVGTVNPASRFSGDLEYIEAVNVSTHCKAKGVFTFEPPNCLLRSHMKISSNFAEKCN